MKVPKEKEFFAFLKESERTENTISAYIYSVKCYFEDFNKLSKDNLLSWKSSLVNEKGLSHRTANQRICGINVYCEWLGKNELKLKQYKIQRQTSVSNVISLRQYNKLLNCLKKDGNFKWYFIVKTMAMTGVRVSELIQIKLEDFENAYCLVYNKGKNRKIYIPQLLCDEVLDYYSDYPYVVWLCENRYKKQMSTRGIGHMLREFSQKYGIDEKVMHPHSFRHLFAIQFLKNNKEHDLVMLQNLMGHSSINTTAIYLQKTEAEQIRCFNKSVCW